MHDLRTDEPILLDYVDYCALPEDGRRYEILDGVLYLSPCPQTLHQAVNMALGNLMWNHVRAHKLGRVFLAPYDILLAEHCIVQPDISFVSNSRRDIVTFKHIRGVPDLLVEIVSPSRPEVDTRDKRQVYARCGVPWFWIVDPGHRRLYELRLRGRRYVKVAEASGRGNFTPGVFTGLQVPLAEFWA